MCVMGVEKPLHRNRISRHIRKFTLEKKLTYVESVGKLLAADQAWPVIKIFIITWLTLARKCMSVKNAARDLVAIQISVATRKSTLERSLSNVGTVKRPLVKEHILPNIREFTLAKALVNVRVW